MEQRPLPVQDGKIKLNAESLKTLRKQRGLSQEGLAALCLEHRLCVSIASIKRAETGKSVLYRTASHLARIYARDLHELAQAGSGAVPAQLADAEEPELRTVLSLSLVLAHPLPSELTALADQLIQRFGGQPQAPELAIFGLPRAYGSDAVRCLQCADALAALLAGQRATLVLGLREWPQAAAQPQRLAALLPAQPPLPATLPAIFVERAMAVELGEHFVLAPSGDASDWLRFVAQRSQPRSALSPLVGRHLEVRQFKAVLETTLAYQAGHILYLRGVAGIGKSRLVQELAEIAREAGFDSHLATVLDFGGDGAAAPQSQLVRSLLALPAGVAPTEDELAAQMNASGLPAELAMYYRAILGLPQPGEAAAVFGAMAHTARASGLTDAVRELILRKAIGGPLLLVLEDVHWSKPELLTMLAALLPDVQQLPLVWVLSSRFEHDPLDAALRPYLNGLAMTVFDLATLRSSEALALAAQSGNPDPDFHAQCVARAQGNPLFLTQLLLSGRSGALPSSVKNLVQTKLDRLSSPQRRALRVASAIGQRFSAELLSQVLGQADDGLEVAVRHCLVRPAEPGSYVFVHDLVMHGVYESMSPSQRATVHHAIALCYPPGEPLRAQHLHRARHADAPAAYLAAIADRIAAFQYPQALDLLEQCQRIDYAELDDCAVNLLAGECHAKMGQTQRAKASYSAALAQAAGRDQHIAAVLGLARALNLLEDMDAEERLLDQAIADFGNAGGGDGVSELYYLKGNIYFPRGNFTLSRQLHQQAQRHAQSKGSEARALSGIGDSYYAQGRILTAHTVFIECLGLCERYGLADIEASNRFMLGTVRLYLNQTNDALADALASAELGRRVGNRRAEIVSRLTAGWTLISSGQAGRAREQIELGLALARKIGAARFEPFLNESLARVLLIEGNRGEALELALQAWDMVQRQKLQHFIGPWVLGTVALLTPAAADCRRALQQGQELLDEGCVGHNYYRYYASAMEASLMHGELDQALAYANRFDAYLADERCPWAVHQLALVRASASWMGAPQADAAAELATLFQHGQHAGLGQVMPLLHQHLLARLPAR